MEATIVVDHPTITPGANVRITLLVDAGESLPTIRHSSVLVPVVRARIRIEP
jgi:hypothetical protein